MGLKYDIDLQMNVQDARASIAVLKGEITNLKKLVSKDELKLGAVDANTSFNNLRKGFDTAFKAIQKEAAVASSQIEKNIQVKNLDRIMQQWAAAKSTAIDKYGEYAGERFYQKRVEAANQLKVSLSGAAIAAEKLAAAEAKAVAQAHSRVQDKAAANIMGSNIGYANYRETSANATQRLLAENAAYDRKLRAQQERSSDLVAARIMQSDLNLYTRRMALQEKEKIKKLADIEELRRKTEQAAKLNAAKSTGDGGIIDTFMKRLGIAADFSIAYQALQSLYAGMRMVKDAAVEVISSFDELAATQAKLAMWANIITKDGMSYDEAFTRAGVNMRAFNVAAIGALSSTKDLSTAIDEFAQQGLIFGPNMQKEMVRFADFVLMVAQTTGNSARQVRQEVQAIFSGNIRPENQVLRTMKNFNMLSAENIKDLKSGAIDPTLIRGIIEKISTHMGPVYDAMFGSSVEASTKRFKNTFIASYVNAMMDANAELNSKNLFADAINQAYKQYEENNSVQDAVEKRIQLIKDLASIFAAVAPVIVATVSGIEKAITGLAAMFGLAADEMKRIKNIAQQLNQEEDKGITWKKVWEASKTTFKFISPSGPAMLLDQRLRNEQQDSDYRASLQDEYDVRGRDRGGLDVNMPRKPAPKENKAISSAEKHLRDLVDQIRQLGEVSDSPLDTASRKLTAFWDKLNDTYRETSGLTGKWGKEVIKQLDETAPKAYDALFKSMVEDLDKAVQDGTGITIKQAERYKELLADIEDQTNNLTRKQWRTKEGDRPLLAADTKAAVDAKRLDTANKLAAANATREANAMAGLYKYSDPTNYAFDQRIIAIQKEFDGRKAQVTDTQKLLEIERERAKVIERIEVERKGGFGAVVYGAEEGIKEYGAKITNTFQNVKEAAARAMQSVEDSIVNAFEKGEWGASQFFQLIQHELIKLAVQRTITGPMSTFLGQILGSFGVKHGGGEMGTTHGGTRALNPMVFANAPRFHNGLRSDEFPAILQSGENVTRRGGELPSQTIVIENHTGQQVQKQEKQGANGSRELRFIIGDTVKQIVSSGQLDTTFKQTFGLKRVGVA